MSKQTDPFSIVVIPGKYPAYAYPNTAYVDGRLVPQHRSDFTIELDWDERLSVA